jgi:hypothetical protein
MVTPHHMADLVAMALPVTVSMVAGRRITVGGCWRRGNSCGEQRGDSDSKQTHLTLLLLNRGNVFAVRNDRYAIRVRMA